MQILVSLKDHIKCVVVTYAFAMNKFNYKINKKHWIQLLIRHSRTFEVYEFDIDEV